MLDASSDWLDDVELTDDSAGDEACAGAVCVIASAAAAVSLASDAAG